MQEPERKIETVISNAKGVFFIVTSSVRVVLQITFWNRSCRMVLQSKLH